MYKAFEIAGYTREEVDTSFPGMIGAFKFGAPPHGGSAPGIDRIVMLLADEPNIREVIVFPMNQKAEDLMMNAPAPVMDKQLKELVDPDRRRRRAEGLAHGSWRSCHGATLPLSDSRPKPIARHYILSVRPRRADRFNGI